MTKAGEDLLARARARRALVEAGSMPAQVRQLQEGSRRLLEDARRLRERFDAADRRREAAEREAAARAEEQALSEAQALPPRAAKLFDDWRGLGRTAAEAMDEVRRSGIQHEESLEETFRGMRGMTPEAARLAARGRDGDRWVRPADPFDALVESFQRMRGMTPEAAREAAIGRGRSEAEARMEMRESALHREAEVAFAEAARAVADRHKLDPSEAVARVQAKVRAEWSNLDLAEGVARLRAYARQLTGD
ncbi:hypothetical protein ACGFIJ_29990 [Microbispora bryophytorum]|uniref:hypothetical protein n=1 Tax=Microbispora bryophytorum TaxID=1460882 RepID=UPI00371C4EF6